MSIVRLALLADFAVAHPDGKLYVTGGGIRSLSFPAFPATRQHLALAVGLEVPAEGLEGSHLMSIHAVGPSDEQIIEPIVGTFTAITPPLPNQPPYFHFVTTIEDITFPSEGAYRFVINIDGEPHADIPLQVDRILGQLPPALESAARLQEGYEAWGRGEPEVAKEVFRDVTTRFPAYAAGHNNLGFVLLAQGDAEGALQSLQKARELDYGQREVLDANIACANYLRGDCAAAVALFQGCLRYGFRGQAVLFGIDGDRLFPAQLNSASDYVALMMLNLAWSAYRAGDLSEASRHVDGARASDLARREDEGAANVAHSIESLKAQLT
jgi:hypothetical protein